MSGFDGGGTYVRNYNWTQDAANGIPITASRFDAEHNGFASGLSNCITRDGQGKPVADISWNNHKIITLADPSLPQDAVTLAFLNSNSGLLNLLSTRVKYDITPAEIAASVTPTFSFYLPLDPLRYGALGDGVTDDTVALNKWVAVVNASTNPVSTWTQSKTYLCGGLNAITATDHCWQANGCTIKVKANSWNNVGDGVTHVNHTGARLRLHNLTIDGNQAAFAAQQTGRLLTVGDNFVLINVTCKNSGTDTFRISSNQGACVACHFDDNANLGTETSNASYLKFSQCTWNRNGYGFQKTLATNAFSGFGVALRFRTHHVTFIDCEAMQNGRDGICTNQGSYAIKYIGCRAWMNGDGGFTVASDVTGGSPGDGERCYDLEYIDCEAYNNWSSGLSAYNGCFNVTVNGGRYYNNHRCAGILTDATSYNSGIYFASVSVGINIDAKCYDDRQLCPVTANAAGVLTATGWVTGTMAYYPRVALYDSSLAFQGYATITAESTGSVTVATTAFNNVTVASIAAGWFVSQRVQHNGVMFDNNCLGSAVVDGFGFMAGVQAYYGFKIVSGWNNNGQNISVPQEPLDLNTELLLNPSFEVDATNWTYSLIGGGSATRITTSPRRSIGSLRLIGGTSAAFGDATLDTNAVLYAANTFIEFSIWCFATAAGDATIFMFWNAGSSFQSSVNHPGGGWRQLKISAFLPNANTSIGPRIQSAIGKTCYFDVGSLRVRNCAIDNRDFSYSTRNLSL